MGANCHATVLYELYTTVCKYYTSSYAGKGRGVKEKPCQKVNVEM